MGYLLTLTWYLPGLSKLVAVKLISTIFDFVGMIFVYKIVQLKYPAGIAPVFAALAFLFAPTVFLNSGLWGQSDIIYTTGLLACLYFLLVKREALAFVAVGLAFAFKLQALFFAPLLLVLLLKKYVTWPSFLIIPLVYVAAILPAAFIGRSFSELLFIYLNQSNYYQALTKNAPNLYQWFPDKYYDIFYPAGLIWTAALIFMLAVAVYKSKVLITNNLIILLALISVILMPYFLPKMHDRYFFAADVISIIFAFYFPRYFLIPILVGLVSLFSYFPFLFGREVVPLPLLALVLLAVIVVLARHLFFALQPDQEFQNEGARQADGYLSAGWINKVINNRKP